jgi:hypothetical protein
VSAVPGRWDAYLSAELRIETPAGVVLVSPMPLMQTAGEYPDPQGRTIAVITAHNPGGQPADEETNAARQRALEAELDHRGLAWWRADGADPSWTHVEQSAAVPGLALPDAIALGAQFGQEAIFLLSPTSLTVADCATGKIALTGWHVEPDEDHDHLEDHEASEIEVRVFAGNLRSGDTTPGGQAAGAATAWPASLGHRAGLLCTVHTADIVIALHGDGHGGVLMSGAPGTPNPPGQPDLPRQPIPVDDVPYALAATDVFETAPGFATAAWDAGEVATLFASFLADRDFLVDGTAWSSDGSRAYPASATGVPGLVLAESRWESDRDSEHDEHDEARAHPPGYGDRSGDYLLRIGPWYVVYQTNGDEREIDNLDADTDQAAVTAFKAYLGVPE